MAIGTFGASQSAGSPTIAARRPPVCLRRALQLGCARTRARPPPTRATPPDASPASHLLRLVYRGRRPGDHRHDIGPGVLQPLHPARRLRGRARVSRRARQQRDGDILHRRRHRRGHCRPAGRPHRRAHRHCVERDPRRRGVGLRRPPARDVASVRLSCGVRPRARGHRSGAGHHRHRPLVQRAPLARVLHRLDRPVARRRADCAARGAGDRTLWPVRCGALDGASPCFSASCR